MRIIGTTAKVGKPDKEIEITQMYAYIFLNIQHFINFDKKLIRLQINAKAAYLISASERS